MMLDHYQQTKNLLVSCSENKLGFFCPFDGVNGWPEPPVCQTAAGRTILAKQPQPWATETPRPLSHRPATAWRTG